MVFPIMIHDRIYVFNKITDGNTLTKKSLFKSLIGIDYPKFREVYEIISCTKLLDSTDNITCDLISHGLKFKINTSEKVSDDILDYLSKMVTKKNCKNINAFTFTFKETNKNNITIIVIDV